MRWIADEILLQRREVAWQIRMMLVRVEVERSANVSEIVRAADRSRRFGTIHPIRTVARRWARRFGTSTIADTLARPAVA
jgi:hypothetical protein